MLRVPGSKIYISVFSLLLVLIICFSVDAPFFFIAVLGAAVHEAAHLIAIRLLGASVLKISIYPFGVDIRTDTSALSYKREIIVAAAGPLAGLLLFLLSFTLYLNCGGLYILAFAVSNFLFFLVNILPVNGLDGGRVLLSFLLMHLEYSRALRLYDRISCAFFGVLCLLALLLLCVSGYNLSLIFVCAYLFISGYIKQKCT